MQTALLEGRTQERIHERTKSHNRRNIPHHDVVQGTALKPFIHRCEHVALDRIVYTVKIEVELSMHPFNNHLSRHGEEHISWEKPVGNGIANYWKDHAHAIQQQLVIVDCRMTTLNYGNTPRSVGDYEGPYVT